MMNKKELNVEEMEQVNGGLNTPIFEIGGIANNVETTENQFETIQLEATADKLETTRAPQLPPLL